MCIRDRESLGRLPEIPAEIELTPRLKWNYREDKGRVEVKLDVYKRQLEDCPVIAAVKDETGLKECLYSESQIIFCLLYTSRCV